MVVKVYHMLSKITKIVIRVSSIEPGKCIVCCIDGTELAEYHCFTTIVLHTGRMLHGIDYNGNSLCKLHIRSSSRHVGSAS